MKYLIILGDGMADYPIAKLGNKTPLMVADKPSIDYIAKQGRCGRLVTIPDDMPAGSEVANMSVLGYDPAKYVRGRGVLEAASMGVALESTDIAMRCNLICIENGNIKNHSAGHISTEEASRIIATLNEKFSNENLKFYPGVSYRHLLVLKTGSDKLTFFPPHDYPGKPFANLMIKPNDDDAVATADLLNGLILKSQKILKEHPVNIAREKAGKDPANSVWFWSAGRKPSMPTLKELYGLSGAVISAVDLIQGIGVYAGMDVIKVEGATGLYNTNYEGKAKAAIEALKTHDFVYLHVEATDEAGHEGDVELKIKTIEYLDKRVVKYILENTGKLAEPLTIAILPDHPTPCEVRTHTRDAVPFAIFRPGKKPDEVKTFDEASVEKGGYGILKGDGFMRALLGK
jgi:2,3-bisphosphoglycerate-independent phosphoglycerate mutase